MAAQPASTPQVEYIVALADRLQKVLDDEDDTPERVKDGCTAMTRAEASKTIDALITAIGRVGGRLSQNEQDKLSTAFAPRPVMSDERRARIAAEKTEQEAAREEWRREADEFNTRERRAFGGPPFRREAPDGLLVVWKERPNTMGWSWDREVSYGWRWICRHEKHRWPVRGGSDKGWAATRERAAAHWEKHHAGESYKPS